MYFPNTIYKYFLNINRYYKLRKKKYTENKQLLLFALKTNEIVSLIVYLDALITLRAEISALWSSEQFETRKPQTNNSHIKWFIIVFRISALLYTTFPK